MGSFLSDLILFIYTVLSYWQAYITGGLITAGVGIYERLTDKRLTKRAYVGLFVITFLLASFFLAWRDERLSLKNAKQELSREKDQNAPKLGGHIEKVIISDSTDVNGAQVFVLLSIGNTGGTSIVEDFLLKIRLTDFDHDVGAKDFPGETISLLDEKNSKVTIHPQDTMKIKEGKPIERGYKVRGWLMFPVEGVKPEIIRRPKTQFTISFKDVWGQTYSATYEMPQHSVNS
jgi:hypothetical protein